MQTPAWLDRAGVIGRLLARPQRHDFFQAVRLLDVCLGVQPAPRTLEGTLRFSNSVSLAFPASEIEALDVDGPHVRMTPAFIGFLGVKGVLPFCYTETVAAQVYGERNDGTRAFLDCFSQRAVLLFYRAWERCRVEYRSGNASMLAIGMAIAGHARRAPDETIPDEAVAHYAAALRQRPVSAALLSAVLNDYFRVPIRIEPFVEFREPLAPDERATLGSPHCRLGASLIIGRCYRTRDTCVRLWIGPLSRSDYERFLADGDAGRALKALLSLFAVSGLRFEVRPILRGCDVRPTVLDGTARLGRAAVLGKWPAQRDHDATRYLIEPV